MTVFITFKNKISTTIIEINIILKIKIEWLKHLENIIFKAIKIVKHASILFRVEKML